MRGALIAASERFGLEVAIPATTATTPILNQAPRLSGRLTWDDASSSWDGSWTLTQGTAKLDYVSRSDSFDEAFRAAILGATRVMSGH